MILIYKGLKRGSRKVKKWVSKKTIEMRKVCEVLRENEAGSVPRRDTDSRAE